VSIELRPLVRRLLIVAGENWRIPNELEVALKRNSFFALIA
jgi:hypothetical protein